MRLRHIWRRLMMAFQAWTIKRAGRRTKTRTTRRRTTGRSEMSWRRCFGESLEDRAALSATPTDISVAVSSASAVYGQAITLTATVAAATTPSEGTVTFLDNGNVLGTASVSSGTATLANASLNAGSDQITASYSDSRGNYASSATTAQPSSLITTLAGTGSGGYVGDGGLATSAEFNDPVAIALDAEGDLFIADMGNHVVREVAHATGVITTVAGDGTAGYSGDGGLATSAELRLPTSIAVDTAGDLIIADEENDVIREVNHATGIITTVAGNGTAGYSGDGGAATSAELNLPTAIALDAAGDMFIADAWNNRIREVNRSTGVITTAAGNGTAGFSGDGLTATSAQLNDPQGIAVDSSGDLFIADYRNSRIREVNHSTRVITTVAGDATPGYNGDNILATSAEINSPVGVVVDAAGNLFFADMANCRIREISQATGIITTVAGDGTFNFGGDGGAAASAQLANPFGVAIDSNGSLLIADTDNERLREVTNGASVSVAPAPLTITADDQTKVYGAALPTLTATYVGFVNGDGTSSLTTQPMLSTTATSASPLGPYVITVGGAADPNYTISYANGVLSVIPVPAAVDDVYIIGSGTVTVAAGDGVLANDTPSGGLTVNAGTAAGVTGGTFMFHTDGSFIYTPPARFAGYDQAQYTVNDGHGDTSTATVMVVSQTGGVVWKFYESVLGRSPDDPGLAHWIADLAQGGSTGDLAVAFEESDELLDRIIGGYYEQYLGRPADAAGLENWKSVWRAAGGPEVVQADMASSTEFFDDAGGTTAGWLTAIYERVLDRAPDAQGFDYWMQRLASGTTEVDVVLGFVESREAFSDDVTTWFEQDFEVKPSAEQLDYYVGQMLAGNSDAAIEQELASNPAYLATVPLPAPGAAIRLPDYLDIS